MALPLGTRIEQTFMVLDIDQRAGDAPHTILTLVHAGGRIRTAPFWASESHRLEGITAGRPAAVRGRIGSWRERRQLIVETIAPLDPAEVDWDALLPSIGDPAPWWHRLDQWRADVSSPMLRGLLARVFEDPDLRARFQRCPASIQGHHARLGGLLQHSCEVAHLALAAATIAGNADLDLLLAGALLHDVGKLESYRWDGAFRMTVAGQVLGHVVLGALLLDRVVRPAGGPYWPEVQYLPLLHLILSHHGQLEFGAAVPPMTLEAEVLHHADLTSARARSMADALADDGNFGPEEISRHPVWQLDRRRVWRSRAPDHATAAG